MELVRPPPPPLVLRRKEPIVLREFTLEELRNYNGATLKDPIYIAISGKVFDVSRGRNFYGPGMAPRTLLYRHVRLFTEDWTRAGVLSCGRRAVRYLCWPRCESRHGKELVRPVHGTKPAQQLYATTFWRS